MSCAHAGKVLRARRVSAVIHNGHLLGVESLDKRDPLRRLQPQMYEVVDFCADPTCEKVFRSQKMEAEV